MYANGVLIQAVNQKNETTSKFIRNFKYLGLGAFLQYPLSCINNPKCRALTKEQQSKRVNENWYVNLEFISSVDLYERYVKMCLEMEVDIRVLFVESAYSEEIWNAPLPSRKFIGYEYSPIPIDDQIITDIEWYRPFSKYWRKLNCYGLFDTYGEAKQFKDDYNKALFNGSVGDGDVDAYICRVSEVCLDKEIN